MRAGSHQDGREAGRPALSGSNLFESEAAGAAATAAGTEFVVEVAAPPYDPAGSRIRS